MWSSDRKRDTYIYRIIDFVMAMIAWACFYAYRKNVEVGTVDWSTIIEDPRFLMGIILVPIWWLSIYFVFDRYTDVYRLSRFATLIRTFLISFMGCLFLLFTILLDDRVLQYRTYLDSFLYLFGFHFLFTATGRMLWLHYTKQKLKNGKVSFNTLIIGGDTSAVDLYKEINGRDYKLGNKFVGYIDSNGNSTNYMQEHLQQLGAIENIGEVITQHQIEDVIIAIETSEHGKLKGILDTLFDYNEQVLIKIIPDMYDILLGSVKMTHLYGAVLIEISQEIMPRWQKIVKRTLDIGASVLMLILLIPVFVYVAIRVKFSSKGPVFFLQERIGKNGKPFDIIKFRSMYLDAEEGGPQLSHDHDDRCTPWGKVMRKWRLDEFPQFYNVLKGEMSLVGPRPERQFFIDQIMEKAPHYRHLLKVRPGITSWGQVKYGYASNIDQMIQRLKFDILYIENMSLSLDFKIMFYTILVLIQGKGK